jgi:chromosome partitioning protein
MAPWPPQVRHTGRPPRPWQRGHLTGRDSLAFTIRSRIFAAGHGLCCPEREALVPMLTIIGSKGGVGKSTLASNLLVAARLAGHDAAGLDLDPQASLVLWASKRAGAGAEPTCDVSQGKVPTWKERATVVGSALLVVDTPPGLAVREHRRGIRTLALASAVVIIPTLPEGPTIEMLGEVGGALRDAGAPVLFVLNKIDTRRRATRAARAYLAEYGEVSAVEIPAREHVHLSTHVGLTVVEDPKAGGHEQMGALWSDVAGRLGLG